MRNTGLGESVSSRKPIGEGREIVWEKEIAEGPLGVPKAWEEGVESVTFTFVEGARSEDVVSGLEIPNTWFPNQSIPPFLISCNCGLRMKMGMSRNVAPPAYGHQLQNGKVWQARLPKSKVYRR